MKKKKSYRQIKSIDEVLKLIRQKGKIIWWNDEETEKEAIEQLSLACKYSSVSTCDKENLIVLAKDHTDNDWGQVNYLPFYCLYHGIWLERV
jgi:hypothetical protein